MEYPQPPCRSVSSDQRQPCKCDSAQFSADNLDRLRNRQCPAECHVPAPNKVYGRFSRAREAARIVEVVRAGSSQVIAAWLPAELLQLLRTHGARPSEGYSL